MNEETAMEYFATKLASGRVKSPKISWWLRHGESLLGHMGTIVLDSRRDIKKTKKSLVDQASEWQLLVPHAVVNDGKGLMVGHVGFEIDAIEAAASRNRERLDRAMRSLSENARSQAIVYGASMVNFPERTFEALLGGHLHTFIESLSWLVEGNAIRFQESEFQRRGNSIRLAAFTAEWF